MPPVSQECAESLFERPEYPARQPQNQLSGYGTIHCEETLKNSASDIVSQDGNPANGHGVKENCSLLVNTYAKFDDDTANPAVWNNEFRTIVQYSAPMTLSLLLQYSLTTSSIFVVGHLGKRELGAVSLANMTAIITGYAVYQGFATSLDTLCPQAFGSGKLQLVGLHTQRLTLLLLLATVPIGITWLQADKIFSYILPSEDLETAELAGTYLRIILFGAPGYACFEAGKRFVQAQGLFHASLHVLLVLAPLNAGMSWFLVWKLQWGFVGAPISVAITNILQPLLLAVYVRLTTSLECWHPISRDIFRNWRPMLHLAVPGLLNIESEFLAWEILTLVSSYLGSTALAAQSALYSVVCIAYQVSFSASIGSSTRIATLVGAGRERSAVVSARVALCLAAFIGVFNIFILLGFSNVIPSLFTANEEVISLMKSLLPLCAALQIFDAVNTSCNGILRAVGKPAIGSYVQLSFYYLLSLPVGLWLAFWGDWGLAGIWIGMVLGLFGIAVVEMFVILRIDWRRAIWEASERNLGSGFK